MINKENVIKAWEIFRDSNPYEICNGKEFRAIREPEYCMGQMIEDTIALLKEQEWNILTEDADGIVHGLPGDDGTYLMTDGKDIWIDDYVDGVDDSVFLDSGRDIREIKAWMYMPKLPKEGR